MSTPEIPHASVNDVQIIKARGPWSSKSGGDLMVRLALSVEELQKLLDFDNAEFARIEQATGLDIRGLRTYEVRDIPAGSVGGKEWHAARTEVLFANVGRASLRCVDHSGRELEVVLDKDTVAILPPGIFHTYTALEDGTALQVLCNTLYLPDDSRTHDTYSRELFDQLRAEAA